MVLSLYVEKTRTEMRKFEKSWIYKEIVYSNHEETVEFYGTHYERRRMENLTLTW